MASTTWGLGCRGATLLLILILTSLKSLLSTIFSWESVSDWGRVFYSIYIQIRGFYCVLIGRHTLIYQQKLLMDLLQSRGYERILWGIDWRRARGKDMNSDLGSGISYF
jgi:hypothetical protein